MKKGIHPEWKNTDIKFNGKTIMVVGSTLPEINVEIWAGNHPFYTGKQALVDTDNLVEKYNAKVEAAKANSDKSTSRKEKRLKRLEKAKARSSAQPVTLKDMLKQMS